MSGSRGTMDNGLKLGPDPELGDVPKVAETLPEGGVLDAKKGINYEVKIDEHLLDGVNAFLGECQDLDDAFKELEINDQNACKEWLAKGKELYDNSSRIVGEARKVVESEKEGELRRLVEENNLPVELFAVNPSRRIDRYKTASWRDFSRLDGKGREPAEVDRRKAEAFLPPQYYQSSTQSQEGTLRNIWKESGTDQPWPGLEAYNTEREAQIIKLVDEIKVEPEKFSSQIDNCEAITKSIDVAFRPINDGIEKVRISIQELDKKAQGLRGVIKSI